MRYRELPTVVRRVFDEYLSRYASENPGARFKIAGDPRIESNGKYIIPFEDSASGTVYEVTISPEGEVGATLALR